MLAEARFSGDCMDKDFIRTAIIRIRILRGPGGSTVNDSGDFSRNNLDCLRLVFAGVVVLFHIYALTQISAATPVGRQRCFALIAMHLLEHRRKLRVDFRRLILFLGKLVIKMDFENSVFDEYQSCSGGSIALIEYAGSLAL